MEKKQKQATITIEPMKGKIAQDLDEPITEVEILEEWDEDNHPNFIESNTQAISLSELSENCIVPTFADNSLSIPSQDFIESVMEAGKSVFGELTPVEIRVSHPVNGRVPSALHKKTSELTEDEKTLYYQRLAFVFHAVSHARLVNSQPVHLCIGGVRSYNEDKLYGRKSPMKFKIFCGWQVSVCSNLMICNDGVTGSIECLTTSDIKEHALELFRSFDQIKDENLTRLESLDKTGITEEQFCGIVGRLRLYQALRPAAKSEMGLPCITLGDQAISAVVRGYVDNPNFRKEDGSDTITLWQLLQLFNEAAKQTYIDRMIERNLDCTKIMYGLEMALNGESQEYAWFLN